MNKYDPKSMVAEEFINHEEILDTIKYGEENKYNHEMIETIIKKAREYQGITHREAVVLLSSNNPEMWDKIFALAKEIKEKIYGKRIVMFAPLYLSNYCVNGCTYCPYHQSNSSIKRKKLTQEEIQREVIALCEMGHKRLALEVGEDPINSDIDYVLESIKTIYAIKHNRGNIRRVNVNIAATTVENYKKLHEAEIGTYILFQETYHKETYKKVHPKGPKSNYAYHTEAMDRAMTGGIDDVGVGALFGLYDYKYEIAGMLMHKEHLEEAFGVGPHTVSVPRIRPADDVDLTEFPYAIEDEIFKRIIAVLRIAVPYTGIIVSTRESQQIRKEVLEIGVSQISGGSSTSVGGYVEKTENTAQFEINDTRTLDEIVAWLLENGYVPSFCTACYKEGRTGDRFMRLAKSGQIVNVCKPNSVITLQEYLMDCGSPISNKVGAEVVTREVEEIPNAKVKNLVKNYLEKLELGERDFRF